MDAADLITGYASAGLGVFPLQTMRDGRCTCGWAGCHSPAKHPLIPHAHRKDDPARDTCRGECGRLGHGLYDATTDLGQIAEWLAAYPGCNWAVRPPLGVIILDVDPRNGGGTAMLELQDKHGKLPPTLTAKTGGGGLHIWLSYNGPTRGKLTTGVDVKCNTGYVVAPPSLHESGRHYDWLDTRPAAYAPQWVKNMLNPPVRRFPPRQSQAGEGSLDGLIRAVLAAGTGPGSRNDRLYWACCRAHEKGLDTGPLVDAAISLGLTTHAALATANSAAHAPPKAQNTRPPSVAEFMSRKATV